jgi:hypothetical protein
MVYRGTIHFVPKVKILGIYSIWVNVALPCPVWNCWSALPSSVREIKCYTLIQNRSSLFYRRRQDKRFWRSRTPLLRKKVLSLWFRNIVTNWPHGSEAFFRSCKLCSHSRTSHHSMEPEGSLPCSKEPSTDPHPEPDRSSPYHPIPSL